MNRNIFTFHTATALQWNINAAAYWEWSISYSSMFKIQVSTQTALSFYNMRLWFQSKAHVIWIVVAVAYFLYCFGWSLTKEATNGRNVIQCKSFEWAISRELRLATALQCKLWTTVYYGNKLDLLILKPNQICTFYNKLSQRPLTPIAIEICTIHLNLCIVLNGEKKSQAKYWNW